MRYFTRALVTEQEDEIGADETEIERTRRIEEADTKWREANRRYLEYVAGIRERLPRAILPLVNTTLHDAICLSIAESAGSLDLLFDTEHAPFPYAKPRVKLCFRGVDHARGLEAIVGQGVLYEEIYVLDPGYEFSVLFWHSELVIAFTSLTIEPA